MGRPRALRIALLLIPYAAGLVTAILLWGDRAEPLFFATAAEVIALGAVAMSLQGGAFKIGGGRDRRDSAVMGTILISVGVGLGFAFGALARGDGGGEPHLAVVAGALVVGILAFALEALFGPDTEGDGVL